MDEELAKQSYTSTSFVTDKDGNMLEDGVVRTRTGDIIPESEQESIQNIPEDIDGEMPPIELANELPARDGNLDFARDSKTLSEVSQPIEEAEDPDEVSGIGAMFRQSSYVDNMFDYYTDGKVPFSFTKNQVTDDGYDRSSPDVTAAIEELNPSENEIEMLGQAKNYSALETISNSIKADRIDQTEISSHSPFLTIPTMMLIGAGTDPVGIATGVGVGRLAASGLVAIKTAKSALAVRETIRVSKLEATAVTVGAAATSGLTSEYALQQANTQISSEGLYLSTIASGLMAGVITGSSLSIMGNNRTEFLDSLDAEAKVFTDASEVANMTPTTYEKVLGGLSLGGTNKLSVSDNISEREFAYQTGDVSIVKKGTVISNDSAIDIKTKESGYGISASMKIGEIDSKRMDSDIDGKALDEMYQIEAEYNKQKDFMYETEKSKSINEAYTTGKKEIDDSYEQVIKDINDKTEELVRAKNDELLEIRRQESQAKYDKEAEATGVRDQKAQDKIQSKYDKDRTTFEQKLKKYNTTRSQVGKKVDTEVKSLVKKNEAEVIKMRKPVADAEKKLTKSTDRLAKHQDLMATKEKPTKAMIDKHSKLTEEVKQDKITLGRKERAFNKKQKPTKVNVDEVRARLIKEKLDKLDKPTEPTKAIPDGEGYEFTGVHGGDFKWGDVPVDDPVKMAAYDKWKEGNQKLYNEWETEHSIAEAKMKEIIADKSIPRGKQDRMIEEVFKKTNELKKKYDEDFENQPEYDAVPRYGSVAGDDVTYVDPDGRWQDGSHGYVTGHKKFLHKIKGTLHKPLILNEKTYDEVEALFTKLGIDLSKDRGNLKLRLQKEGYDGLVVDFKKDVDTVTKKEIDDFVVRDIEYSGTAHKTGADDSVLKNLGQNQVILFDPKKATREVITEARQDADIEGFFKGSKPNGYTKPISKGVPEAKLTASDLSKIKALEKAKSKIVADAEKLKNKRLKEIDKAKKKATKSRLDDEADLELSTRVESEIGSNWLKKRIDDIFDEDVRSAVKIANNYFKKTGDTLKNINYANMDRIDTNFYVTHRYDPSKMMSDVDGANTAMYNSLRDMIDGDVDETRLMEYATKQVRKIIENEKMNKILDPDTGDMKELKTILPGGTVFKGRKLRINAHLMKDFMRDRVTEVIQDYGHKTSGKIAMKQTWNIDSAESKNNFLRGFIDSSPSSIKRIKHSLDSIDGSVDIDPYRNHLMSKGVRFLTNLNYLNMGGFFGLNTLSELGSVIMFDGIRAFNHIIPALKQSISAASTSPTLKNDMTHMRIGIERVVNERVNLFADPSLADNAGIIDKTMTYATNKMSKFSGLTMVTDVLDTVSALTFVAKIKTGKIDAGHMSDIAHAGLSVDDIKALRDIDFATTNSFGAVEDFDLSKIKDKDLRWKMQRATARNVRGTVLKGDSVQLPSWMVKIQGGTALPKLLFQFLRFPAIAHDKITIRAASNPRIVNSAVGTTTAAMMLWALEELKQAERKKPLTDEEIALKVAGRLPMFSGVGIATQYYDNMDRSGLTGALGVGISRLDRGVNLAYKAKDGKDLSASDQQYLQSMIVPYSFYGVKTLGREIGAIE